MRKLKELVYTDIYDIGALLAMIPYGAQDIYHISVTRYGFVHDVGIKVVLTPIHNGEYPRGWKQLEATFEKETRTIYMLWEFAAKEA